MDFNYKLEEAKQQGKIKPKRKIILPPTFHPQKEIILDLLFFGFKEHFCFIPSDCIQRIGKSIISFVFL